MTELRKCGKCHRHLEPKLFPPQGGVCGDCLRKGRLGEAIEVSTADAYGNDLKETKAGSLVSPVRQLASFESYSGAVLQAFSDGSISWKEAAATAGVALSKADAWIEQAKQGIEPFASWLAAAEKLKAGNKLARTLLLVDNAKLTGTAASVAALKEIGRLLEKDEEREALREERAEASVQSAREIDYSALSLRHLKILEWAYHIEEVVAAGRYDPHDLYLYDHSMSLSSRRDLSIELLREILEELGESAEAKCCVCCAGLPKPSRVCAECKSKSADA